MQLLDATWTLHSKISPVVRTLIEEDKTFAFREMFLQTAFFPNKCNVKALPLTLFLECEIKERYLQCYRTPRARQKASTAIFLTSPGVLPIVLSFFLKKSNYQPKTNCVQFKQKSRF